MQEKRFLSAKEVGEIMGRSTSYAHRYGTTSRKRTHKIDKF